MACPTRASEVVITRLLRPDGARALLVLAHGAGAGMDHPFMQAVAERLAERDVATFRFQFPYMEGGRGWPPDPTDVLVDAVAEAVTLAGEAAPDLPLFAGGKSLGGRMTSEAAAAGRIPERARWGPHPLRERSHPGSGDSMEESAAVRGLVFFGFPLHTRRSPSTRRAEHLSRVSLPMLFLQGDRDELADLELLRPVLDELSDRATLHVVEGADHGFGVLRRSGRSEEEVMSELADVATSWIEERS